MSTPTAELLVQRGTTHGEFRENSKISQKIKVIMRDTCSNYYDLQPFQQEALDMMAHKIGRILAGDPNHQDHWDDIAGYAKLVSDRITPPIVGT